ncbi:MAG: class II aldolase/adducin family protein [Negativicutes bacterium]|nr:class II aldolase/adducin family protein [Negativicutes bacterium]
MVSRTDFCQQIVTAGRRMLQSNLTVETWGNLSLRDPETGFIYITPSAMAYDTIQASDVVVCDASGTLVDGRRKPTMEKELHLAVYRARPEINAILHTHPLYSMVFAVLAEPIPLILEEAAQVLGAAVEVTAYALPGSAELAAYCAAALGRQANACLLRAHGAVCIGETLEQAFRAATVLEMTAQVYYMARSIGQPQALPAGAVQAMQEYVRQHYGQDKPL